MFTILWQVSNNESGKNSTSHEQIKISTPTRQKSTKKSLHHIPFHLSPIQISYHRVIILRP